MQHDPLVVFVGAFVILVFLGTIYGIVRILSVAVPTKLGTTLTALAGLVGMLSAILGALHSLYG
jgi:hypothetical protein